MRRSFHAAGLLSAALCLALLLSLQPAGAAKKPPADFPDVPRTNWAYDAIMKAVELGIMTGGDKGLFGPSDPVTVSQFATLVTRTWYQKEAAAKTAEVGKKPWYAGAVGACEDLGILDGTLYINGFTKATDPLDRYDLAQILRNIMVKQGTLPDAWPVNLARVEVADYKSIPPSYQEAVACCYAAELLHGKNEAGDFGGSGTVTRAEAATVFIRLVA